MNIINLHPELPSPQTSLFRTANALQVTWSERRSFPPVRLGYVTEVN